MSAKILIGLVLAGAAVFAISAGGLQKAKDYFKSGTDQKPAVEGGSQPARPEASIDQMPLTDKERKTSETINKISDGLEVFRTPDELPRNTSDLSRFDVSGLTTVNSQRASAELTPQQQQGAHILREIAIPNEIKYSTSLAGSVPTTGIQLKREEPVVITNAKSLGGSSALQQKIILEQQRAEAISKVLYGDVSNPKFVKTAKPTPTPTSSKTAITPTQTALQKAQATGNTSSLAKQLLAEARARKK